MKRNCVLGLLLVVCFAVGCERLETTKVTYQAGQYPKDFEKQIMTTLTCKYLLYLPEGYSHSGPAWPMMLFLHGAGERGDDLEKVKVHGPPKIVEGRKDFPFIVVSPQCPSDSWWPNEVEMLKNLVDEIAASYNVDEERIYLTGLSMGGYGTWSLASEYPERFAAIAPICGGGEPFFGYKLRNVPVWAFHGAKDNLVPLEKSEQMVEAIKRAGGQAKLTVYPDAGHDSWTATYENEELYKWFLKHKREKKQ
jgi:predicted peptidase